jgi:hypothetical protein
MRNILDEYSPLPNHNEAELYTAGDTVLYVWRDMKVRCIIISNDSTASENIFSLEVIRTEIPLGRISSEGGIQPPMKAGTVLEVKKARGERDIPDTWYFYKPGSY